MSRRAPGFAQLSPARQTQARELLTDTGGDPKARKTRLARIVKAMHQVARKPRR